MDPSYDNLIDDSLIAPPSNKRQRTEVDDSANYFASIPQASTSHYVPPPLPAQPIVQEAPSPEEKKPNVKGGKPPLPRGSACLLCRKRKLRCDAARPKCATCTRLGHECTYQEKLGAERLQQYCNTLEQRIRELEGNLNSYQNAPLPNFDQDVSNNQFGIPANYSVPSFPTDPLIDRRSSLPTSLAQSSPGMLSGLSDQNFLLPQMNSQTPMSASFPSSGSNREDIWASMANSSAQGSPFAAPSMEQHNNGPFSDMNMPLTTLHAIETANDLPPMSAIAELVDIYFSTIHLSLPFIHPARFRSQFRHGSHSSRPSLALVYAMLAITTPYSASSSLRQTSTYYYSRARAKMEDDLTADSKMGYGNSRSPAVGSLTLDTVQCGVLLAIIEFGEADHQQAFMTAAKTARIATMLGLNRLDEDIIASLGPSPSSSPTGSRRADVLRPAHIQPYPTDPVRREEYRRCFWAVFILDKFESATVGWRSIVDEAYLRVLLPCDELSFESGNCDRTAPGSINLTTWPMDMNDPQDELVTPFGWVCRLALLLGRMTRHIYRPIGRGPQGPLALDVNTERNMTEAQVIEMDQTLRWIECALEQAVLQSQKSRSSRKNGTPAPYTPLVTAQFSVQGVVTLLHIFRVMPHDQTDVAAAQYSLQRTFQSAMRIVNLSSELEAYDNMVTSVRGARITPFTVLPPYIIYAFGLPRRYLLASVSAPANDGESNDVINMLSGERTEDLPVRPMLVDESGKPQTRSMRSELDRLDGAEKQRMATTMLEAMLRMRERWSLASKYIKLDDRSSGTTSPASPAMSSVPPNYAPAPNQYQPPTYMSATPYPSMSNSMHPATIIQPAMGSMAMADPLSRPQSTPVSGPYYGSSDGYLRPTLL